MTGLLGRTSGGLPSRAPSNDAARGGCLNEKAVDRSVASRSRLVRGATVQLCSMNFSVDALLNSAWLTAPGDAYGLTSRAGTRGPSTVPSSTGGATWSYQPPAVS